MTVIVLARKDVFNQGDFRLELNRLDFNGRIRYGCFAIEQRADEEMVRHSYRSKICKTPEEAISESWVDLLSFCKDFHDRSLSFVARKRPCGCVVGAVVWDGHDDVYEHVKRWTKDALIDLVTHDVVRAEFTGWDCPHEVPLLKLMEKR